MGMRIADAFCWQEEEQKRGKVDARAQYQMIADWASKARAQNPGVFDQLTEWILTDDEWRGERLRENEQILMRGVLARFKEQNALLRQNLRRLEPSDVVNPAVYAALDRFDYALDGHAENPDVQKAVTAMFSDFSEMRNRPIRELIAGSKTGPTGTDSVALFGYVNHLKELDAGVQWTLFMPDAVKQQRGFTMVSFEYKRLPALRFIGFEGEEYADKDRRMEKMRRLDALTAYRSGFDYDLLLMHFFGKGVDVGEWHGVFGRFFQAETPAPAGFLSYDFAVKDDGQEGLPYLSQFAYATFAGDTGAMHREEGYDGDAMYDVTRNTILGHGKGIPYPRKYWTAEVFPDGCGKPGTAYLFSTIDE